MRTGYHPGEDPGTQDPRPQDPKTPGPRDPSIPKSQDPKNPRPQHHRGSTDPGGKGFCRSCHMRRMCAGHACRHIR